VAARFESLDPEIRGVLGKKVSELGLRLEGSPVEGYVRELYKELDRRGLRKFHPVCYLTDEWGCPDQQPVLGIPFYLADPKLRTLEKAVDALESERQIMMYMRHEAGHVFNYAYRLYTTPPWRDLFGSFFRPYRDEYRPVPFSKKYVRHIEGWYAQKHPDEDFAETFAVWLTPRSGWRKGYAGWPALKKLEYVDELMFNEVAGVKPLVTTRREIDPLRKLKKTLGEHYAEKRMRYAIGYPDFRDDDLRRLFSDAPEYRDRPSAAGFLRRVRKEVRQRVARCTGAYQYAIDQVLEDIVRRCRVLRLRLTAGEEETMLDFAILLAVRTMSELQSRRPRVAL